MFSLASLVKHDRTAISTKPNPECFPAAEVRHKDNSGAVTAVEFLANIKRSDTRHYPICWPTPDRAEFCHRITGMANRFEIQSTAISAIEVAKTVIYIDAYLTRDLIGRMGCHSRKWLRNAILGFE